MKCLLANRFAPLTFRWGFLEARLDQVSEVFATWRQAIGIPSSVVKVRGALSDALPALEPLTLPPRRDLLVQTDSPWTAYFNNSAMGGDPRGAVSHMSRLLSCSGLVICCKPQTWSSASPDRAGTDGAVTLTILSPHEQECLNIVRDIGVVANRGRWHFVSTGQVQPFERPEIYVARRIACRFTPDLLEEYCASFGIRLFDPAFYGPLGVLIESNMALQPGAPELTLRDARAKAGLQ